MIIKPLNLGNVVIVKIYFESEAFFLGCAGFIFDLISSSYCCSKILIYYYC